jgi:class 3 adenylate cyclase
LPGSSTAARSCSTGNGSSAAAARRLCVGSIDRGVPHSSALPEASRRFHLGRFPVHPPSGCRRLSRNNLMQPAGNVTLLFSDIGTSHTPPSAARRRLVRARLGQHRRLLRDDFASHDGYEVNREGESYFGRVLICVRAAAEQAQPVHANHSWPDSLPGPRPNRDPPRTAELAPPKYVGLDVHQAARREGGRSPRAGAVTETTRASNGGPFVFVDMGERADRKTFLSWFGQPGWTPSSPAACRPR